MTEEGWNELKGAGQTYDDLLEQLIQEHNRRQLADQVREIRDADSEKLTSLDDLCPDYGASRGWAPDGVVALGDASRERTGRHREGAP